MIPQARFGRTNLHVSRIALGGYFFGVTSKAAGWDPFSAEGRAAAIRTIHAALEAGIRYLDTAPGYGDGHSEIIFGEALDHRRDQVILATRVGHRDHSPGDIRASVETSLRHLRTDVLDIVQFDDIAYKPADIHRILHDGLLDMLEHLREQGKLRLIGLASAEPWTVRPLIASFRFDMVQIRYNLIDQSAARHVLNEASEIGLGVAAAQPTTAGVLQRICQQLAPHWQQTHDLNDVALKFVLSDSRVHTAVVDLRSPEEVARCAALASVFEPPLDVARLPWPPADACQYHYNEIPPNPSAPPHSTP